MEIVGLQQQHTRGNKCREFHLILDSAGEFQDGCDFVLVSGQLLLLPATLAVQDKGLQGVFGDAPFDTDHCSHCRGMGK